jgi:DNA polymerase-3 subunit gamma/tau
MVRYLRNTLMAKLGGEQTDLLQISGDERARAARTAMLFSEEEITRNLQIMLRSFDDLNYRQEQRFHLELGLMKLVHAQRLLPLEELLSGVAAGGPVRSGGSAPPPRTPSAPPRTSGHSSHSSSAAQSAPLPPRSPFGSGPVMQSAPVAESHATSGSAALATAQRPQIEPAGEVIPFPATSAQTRPIVEAPAEVDPIPAPAPDSASDAVASSAGATVSGGGLDPDELKLALVSALAEGGHDSASQLISTARFTLEATNLRIEVPGIGKKMLSLTVNAAAEKIIRQELQKRGGPGRFMVIPGEGVASTSSIAAPVAGSIQQAALENPMVQRAKEIFKAEVRSVVDLRAK